MSSLLTFIMYVGGAVIMWPLAARFFFFHEHEDAGSSTMLGLVAAVLWPAVVIIGSIHLLFSRFILRSFK